MEYCISCGKGIFAVLGVMRKIAKITIDNRCYNKQLEKGTRRNIVDTASDDRRYNKLLEEGIGGNIVDTISNDCCYNIQSE